MENQVTVKYQDDVEEALNMLCERFGTTSKPEAIRRAILVAASDINPVATDNTEQLAMLRRISQQQSEIVALLEPLHVAGGPRKMHGRLVNIWTSVAELLTPEQAASARANTEAVLSRYGLDFDVQNKA